MTISETACSEIVILIGELFCKFWALNFLATIVTSGAIQGNVPTKDNLVVCGWNREAPKSQSLAVKSADITTIDTTRGGTPIIIWCGV